MKRVEKIAAKADENAVQRTTSTKISHTWLDSRDGTNRPVDQRANPPAALPTAGEQRPEARPEVRSAEDGIERNPDPEHTGDSVCRAHVEGPASGEGAPSPGA